MTREHVAPSGRIYRQNFNTVDVFSAHSTYLFTIRVPTEVEAEIIMSDLEGEEDYDPPESETNEDEN